MAHPRHPQVIGAPFPFTAAPGGNRRARPARGRSGSCQDGNKAKAKLSWFSPAATCSLTWEALAKAQPGDLEPLKRDGLGLCRGEPRAGSVHSHIPHHPHPAGIIQGTILGPPGSSQVSIPTHLGSFRPCGGSWGAQTTGSLKGRDPREGPAAPEPMGLADKGHPKGCPNTGNPNPLKS